MKESSGSEEKLAFRNTPHVPVFEEVVAFHLLHLAPRFLADLRAGAQHHLDRSLLKYSHKLSGVPLCYGKVEVVSSLRPDTAQANDNISSVGPLSGAIYHDNPCVHVAVKVYWTLFSPKVGARIMGKINVITRDHLGLLFVEYFSAIIQASHMQAILEWDEERQGWRSKHSGKFLDIGQEITFEIINSSAEGPVLTIFGSLDRLLEGPVSPVAAQKKDRTPKQSRSHSEGKAHVKSSPPTAKRTKAVKA